MQEANLKGCAPRRVLEQIMLFYELPREASLFEDDGFREKIEFVED